MAGATYVSQVISSVNDRRLKLDNFSWAAPIAEGTDWNEIRIGCRWSQVDTGANITGTPKIYIGLLSSPVTGLTNGVLTSSTSHFVGIHQINGTMSRATTPTRYTHAYQSIKRVGSTNTVVSFGTSASIVNVTGNNARSCIFVEILKGSPNYTIRMCGINNATALGDISESQLTSAMEHTTIGAVDLFMEDCAGATGYYNTSIGTLAVNEGTDGALNAIHVGTSMTTGLMEWSDIRYSILG